jgi:hypothetical protein
MSFNVARTFPFNNVVNDPFVGILILGKREDEFFVTWWKDKILKRAVVPNDFLDIVHLELSCFICQYMLYMTRKCTYPNSLF